MIEISNLCFALLWWLGEGLVVNFCWQTIYNRYSGKLFIKLLFLPLNLTQDLSFSLQITQHSLLGKEKSQNICECQPFKRKVLILCKLINPDVSCLNNWNICWLSCWWRLAAPQTERAQSVKTIGFLNTGTSQEELRWRSWLGFLDAMCRDLGLGSKKAALNESIFYWNVND